MSRSRFTFSHSNGLHRSVFANSENEARAAAMETQYGKTPQSLTRPIPSTIKLGPTKYRYFIFNRWAGIGLTLIEVIPILQVTE